MIYLTQLNTNPVVLNAEIIERVESTPDTVISFTTGKKIMVRESVDEVVRLRQLVVSLGLRRVDH